MPFELMPDPVAAAIGLTLVLAAVSAIPLIFNLLGRWNWDDWLDQRIGRGSIKDEFPHHHW